MQILTFVKVFHWLVQDRVDYMETTPATSRLQHLRIVAFMAVLLVRACRAVLPSWSLGQLSVCFSVQGERQTKPNPEQVRILCDLVSRAHRWRC